MSSIFRRNLGAAQCPCRSRTISNVRSKQAVAGIDQTRHFVLAQDLGELAAHLRIGQELAELVPKPSGLCTRIMVQPHGARPFPGRLPHLEKIGLVGAKMIRSVW